MTDDTLSREEIELVVERFKAATSACLVVVTGGMPGRIVRLEREAVLGRGDGASVQVDDPGVSRQHARIVLDADGNFVLTDCGSTGGTRVNGRAIGERFTLAFGDKIDIGTCTIALFTQHDDELERRLLLSDRLESMGRVAGGIAHDFNNLLAAVLANVHYLESRVAEGAGDDVLDCIDETEAATLRAAALTRQLLTFARGGKTRHEPVSVAAVVADVANFARHVFETGIQVMSYCPSRIFTLGDGDQLGQVLMNLALNANDAMPEGGSLTLTGDVTDAPEGGFPMLPPGKYVLLSVVDTGVGIKPEVLPHVFEPFFSTKEGTGTGLGLATAYGIVANHGGRIDVESEVGAGTTFRIYLPLVPRPKKDDVDPLEGLDVRVGELTVLVVDDEPLVRNSIGRVLEREGHEVVSASTGAEAIEMYAADPTGFDLVLLDIFMPKLDGADTFRYLVKVHPDVVVVLMSGYTHDSDTSDLLAQGAAGFVSKPFTRRALTDAVINAVSRAAARRVVERDS